jgi:ABC-2 type transport system permease protein
VNVPAGGAEVFDLGYHSYEGERTGRWSRRRAIWRDGVRIALGLGRGAGAKIAPWLLIAIALVPAAVIVVIAAFVGTATPGDTEGIDIPSYADYFNFAIVPLSLFAAIIAPNLTCSDRRDGVLALYAARPISPTDYVAARWTAFFTVAAAVAWLPEVVLFVWNLLDAPSTGSWLADNWDVVPRFLAAGGIVAAALTTLALLAASFTNRRAYATIGMLAVFFIGSAIGGIAEHDFSGRGADVVSLAALPRVIVVAVHWIFGDPLDDPPPLAGGVYALWLAGLTVALGAWLLARTRRAVTS